MQVGQTGTVLAIKQLRVVKKLDISDPNSCGYRSLDLGRSLFPLSCKIKSQFIHTHSGPTFRWVYLPLQNQITVNHSKGFLLCPAFYDTSSNDFCISPLAHLCTFMLSLSFTSWMIKYLSSTFTLLPGNPC